MITTCLFFVVFMTVIFCFGSSLLMLKNKMQTLYICRTQGLQIQKQVQNIVVSLLSLNVPARTLRLQRKFVEAQIVAAFAAGQLELVALLKIKRQKILVQQKILDRTQKAHVRSAHLVLTHGAQKIRTEVQNQLLKLQTQQKDWVETHSQIMAQQVPQFAFKTSDRNLAPQYEPKKDFENKQAIRFIWRQNLNWKGLMKVTQQWNTRIISQCHITLEENTWRPKIQRDKPLLR